MIASISSCPNCNTLILEDTPTCPQCHHVLQEGSESEKLSEINSAADSRYDGARDKPCRECDAPNPDGLVRCWQCGAFLQEDMEQVFQDMQLRPAVVVTDDESSASGVVEMPDEAIVTTTPLPHTGEETIPAPAEDEVAEAEIIENVESDDFDLDEDIQVYMADEEWVHEPHPINYVEETEEEAAAETAKHTDEEDDLFKLAVHEEREQTRKSKRTKVSKRQNSFLIQGPCGCKIRVQRYHQGQIGFCPKCTTPFMVPILDQPKKDKKSDKPEAEQKPLAEEIKIENVRWNEISLKKFKPKANAFKGKGDQVDLIRWEDELLIVWPKQKGLKGNAAKQAETARENIAAHLQAGKPAKFLPTDRVEIISKEKLQQIQFCQPALSENFTAGEPIFGPGMIAFQLPAPPPPPVAKTIPSPKKKKPKKPPLPEVPPARCLTLTLNQYRQLRTWLAELLDQPDTMQVDGIPLEDQFQAYHCNLSEQVFDALVVNEYYQEDTTRPLSEVGWLCQCGEVAISETARVEQKFGGKKPSGLAKTDCPKCEQKFGQNPLYHFTSVVLPKPEIKPEQKADKDQPTVNEDQSGTSTKKSMLGGLFKKKSKSEATNDEPATAEVSQITEQQSEATAVATQQEQPAPKRKKSVLGGLFKKAPQEEFSTEQQQEETSESESKTDTTEIAQTEQPTTPDEPQPVPASAESEESPAASPTETVETPKKSLLGGLFKKKS